MAAELSPLKRARYDAIRSRLDISDKIYGNKTWQPDYYIINWINNNPGFPEFNKENGLFKWPLRSRKEELAMMLEKVKSKPRGHEENPIYMCIPSDFSNEDRCRVKYICEHLDIPYNEVMKKPFDNHVKSIVEWVKTNQGFPNETKDGLFLWPIESIPDPSDPRFLFPKRSCAQRLVPLTGTYWGANTPMIWVPYYCTGEEERIIRDIYRKAELESSEARPFNCSIPSALVITAQRVQSFTIDFARFQYTFLQFFNRKLETSCNRRRQKSRASVPDRR